MSDNNIIIPDSVVAAMFVTGALCIVMPAAALIIWKIKHRSASLVSALAGAVTFVVWALVLEQLLHMFMMPVVQEHKVLYVLYGALAAGVFEETGRFVSFRLFLKKTVLQGNPENGVMFGIGHGGVESALLVGVSLLSVASTCILVNAGGMDMILSQCDEETAAVLTAQLQSYAGSGWTEYMGSVYERVLALILHISMSVMVYAGVCGRKFRYYPIAMACHVLFDIPAAMYQINVVPLWGTYILLTVMTGIFAAVCVRIYKGMKNSSAMTAAQ